MADIIIFFLNWGQIFYRGSYFKVFISRGHIYQDLYQMVIFKNLKFQSGRYWYFFNLGLIRKFCIQEIVYRKNFKFSGLGVIFFIFMGHISQSKAYRIYHGSYFNFSLKKIYCIFLLISLLSWKLIIGGGYFSGNHNIYHNFHPI